MMAIPCDFKSRITSNRFSDSFWDRLEVGSSMMMIRAFTESALEISTNC